VAKQRTTEQREIEKMPNGKRVSAGEGGKKIKDGKQQEQDVGIPQVKATALTL